MNLPPITCTPIAIYRQRLLNAAESVLTWDHSIDFFHPNRIYMTGYIKPCGAPACVLGHYASRQDLQDQFEVRGSSIFHKGSSDSCSTGFMDPEVRDHFGIDRNEAMDLFSSRGCDNAYTGEQVDQYIRAFVDRKYPQWE